MISRRHKYIFIHIPKTAGSSIKRMLSDDETIEEKGWHYTLEHFHRHFPSEFASFFKFAVTRNPFDRFVSAFTYNAQKIDNPDDYHWTEYQEAYSAIAPLIDHNDLISSFRRFVKSAVFENIFDPQYPVHFKPQVDFITVDNRIALDFVSRFEKLQSDIGEISRLTGIACTELPRLNPGHRTDHEAFYDRETRSIVRDKYEADFETLRY